MFSRHRREEPGGSTASFIISVSPGRTSSTSLARRLMLPVSNDTLLRVVRRRAQVPAEPLNVICIDDWAWRRNHRYGTIVCDLERRRPVTLLPDREPATATAWLVGHQEITVVARDRGGEYGEAVTRALPQATQVADRWHLMENASRSFLDAVRKSMRQTERPLGRRRSIPSCSLRPSAFNMKPFSGGKRSTPRSLPWRRTRCRSKRSCVVSVTAGNLFAEGERQDIFRTRQSSLERHLPWLDARRSSGCRNSADLWRRLKGQGFRGSLWAVTEWATRRRRAERADAENLQRIPSALTIARLMTIGRNGLSKSETVTITAIETGVPRLVGAREMIAEFQVMVRNKTDTGLAMWIEAARQSLVASFADGVAKDGAAVRAAITLPWSNGQTEGQITKLRLVKRQMYGRAKIDLLQARLIGVPA
jgi:transposase